MHEMATYDIAMFSCNISHEEKGLKDTRVNSWYLHQKNKYQKVYKHVIYQLMGITSGKGQAILMCSRLSLEKCQVGQKRKGIWSKKKLMPLITKWGGRDYILNARGTRKMAIKTQP